MFLSRRGLGRQEYHSLIGATQVFGMPLVTGLPVSSTISLAGSGGQLLTPNAAPPMNCLNHVHRELRSLNAETWKPSHAPPFSIYRSKAACCAPGGGLLSQTISLYCFRFSSFKSAQLLVASTRNPCLSPSSAKNRMASVAKSM